MAKTYETGLRLLLKHANKYIGKYQPQLQANLTSEQYTALVAVLEAILALLKLLGAEIVND